ncbi:MAG: STN domain-containing protein, partial [Sphingobacterium siyangense]
MSFYQCMRVMKITMVFLTCLLVKVSAFTYGQRITLNKQNSHIPAILKEIRQQSGYDFFYDNGLFNRAKPVNVNLNNATVEEALNICFAGQPFGYVVKNKLVVVTALRTALEKPADVLQQRLAGRVIDQQTKRTLASVS